MVYHNQCKYLRPFSYSVYTRVWKPAVTENFSKVLTHKSPKTTFKDTQERKSQFPRKV